MHSSFPCSLVGLLWLLHAVLLGTLIVMLLKALLVSEVIYDSL